MTSSYIGQQLGNYRIIYLLGRGGFGEVYLGEHIYLKTQAAIKVLHTRLTSNDEQNFFHEARIIAYLKHPHIISVLEFGVNNGFPFLVMDYAPNGTLRQRHPRGVQLLLTTVVLYVKQIADALQYIHDKGLIHRDIKPENILVGHNNEILLSDFGIAVIAQSSRSRSTQEMAGTATYMAPEQFQGKPRRASDQYSLGIVIYEWLVGEPPFHGSFTEIASQHLLMPPPSIHKKVPAVPPAIESVVLKALAKNPQNRFANLQTFATALEEACFLSKHYPSRRTFAMGLAGIVTACLGGGSVAWLMHSQNPKALSGITYIPTTTTSRPQKTTLYTYTGHSGIVYRAAWSPDGRRIASASQDGTIQIWDAVTGHNVITCHNASGFFDVAWSPDGKLLISASDGVQMWKAATGNQILIPMLSLIGHSNSQYPTVFAVAWSSDGKRIASGGQDGMVEVLDLSGNTTIGRDNQSQIESVAWSPDGKYVVFGGHNTAVQVFNPASAGDKDIQLYLGHRTSTWRVAWSPNGKYIASGGATAQVWDALTGRNILTYNRHRGDVTALAWSPDSKYIASGSVDKTVYVWDALTGHNTFVYNEHNDVVDTVAWSPDGKRIASGGVDRTVQVWQAL